MQHDNVQCEFMGFDPDHEIKSFIKSVADKISYLSPSDAALTLAVRNGKDAIQASCRVASQAGVFVAEAASKNPIRAVRKIEREISKQLDNWKAWRKL